MADRRRNASKLDKLAAYKLAREGGKREWKPEADVELYDEVDERQYAKIVKGRLQRDDFIEDDGVDGYADNGMDDWGEPEDNMSDEDVKPRRKEKSKTTKPKAVAPAPVTTTINDYRPKPSVMNEENFMASLMGNMDNIVPDAPVRSRKRKPREPSPLPPSSPSDDQRTSYRKYSSEPSSDAGFEDLSVSFVEDSFNVSSPMKKQRTSGTGITPAIKKINKMKFRSSSPVDDVFDYSLNDIDMGDVAFDEEEDVKPIIKKEASEPEGRKVLANAPIVTKTEVKKKDEDSASWLNVHASLAVADDSLGPLTSGSSTSSANINALEEDGSLRFYWLDYLEQDANIYFIGKLKDKTSGIWFSCCIAVENLQRNLFVLPRERRVEDGYETDIIPEEMDVYRDFDALRKKVGIKNFKGKFVKRKYAFGEPDVPSGESNWLKVVYPFSEPQIPSNVSSPNFSRIFGTSTSAFELLVLKRKIMGPCWLEVKNPLIEHKSRSWCKFEATVSDPKDINPFPETDPNSPKDIPPLNIMSISIRTIVNYKVNKREIVCASARTWSNIDIEDPTPPDQLPCSVTTLIRPLDKFPARFADVARANKRGTISPESNERTLLNRLLVTIYKADPDVIVGHEFLGVTLDVLLTRMKDLKADNWSRIGRFRRSKWPNIAKSGFNLKFMYGRLLCDLASDGAKSMISSTTWSLTEMCSTHLKCDRLDIDPDEVANYFDSSVGSPDRLLTFVRHCELDAHYQMAIAAKVQILPLTRQLTNLAGNAWNKTLNGGRAERNEYILLHEFHRLKYIPPDKTFGKKSAAVVKAEVEEGDGAVAVSSKNKKDKYKGGLVFEPKRGLWDKYILVMDFNSLYPSIIQEYNIDFTTVEKAVSEDGEEKIPEVPSSDVPQGVLPRLIATLVNRRRQVKSLMKDKNVAPAKRLQYDIKQQALKLTANSMYGCLGFEYSRFYARPLAALTTFKGREILTHTRELAESMQLDVVYGDTDSVFVNSNVTDFTEALKISNEFKKHVNERYKLLEIDLDGVFKRLLLLQKKKYAALKMEDATKTTMEIKGLDMKRREYCALSKSVSQFVLDQILCGEATESVVENIHEYLSTIGKDVRDGKIPLDEFIIYKRLGKNPEDYPDAKNQPHVTVALRMKSRGGSARSGDVIPYIFCLGDTGESSKSAQAERARHPDELRKVNSEFKIDYEHYLSQQILPPIERLCDPIEGTDRARLAECLGLDPGRYRSYVSGETEDNLFGTLESQMPDTVRFKDAETFKVRCRHCEIIAEYTPLHIRGDTAILQSTGPICVNGECRKPLNAASLQVQLEIAIRSHISRYYEGWTVCDDPTCRNRTRMMSVYGRRCLRPGCRGSVSFEYSDSQLYNQLVYYSSLFDSEKALRTTKGSSNFDAVHGLHTTQKGFLQTMSNTVDKYLSESGRRWVELGSLFSFMKL